MATYPASDYPLPIFILIAFVATTSSGTNTNGYINAVAGSKAVLECAHNGSLNIETVYWRSSKDDSIIYFPKDGAVSPSNIDERFTFYNNTRFSIDPLYTKDTGIFNCTITSVLPEREVSFSTFLTVLEGCQMWDYKAPLKTLGNGCSPGGTVLFENECSLSCEIGFNLVGQNSSQCGGNGTMSGNLPQCEANICKVENLPPHLTDRNGHCMNESNIMIKEQCTFSCDSGFVIEGRKTIECQPDGTFNGIFPSCIESARKYSYVGFICILMIPVAVLVIWYALRQKREWNQGRTNCEFTRVNDKCGQTDDKLNSADDYACLLNDQLKSMSRRKRKKTKCRIVEILSREEMQIINQIHAIDNYKDDLPVDMSPEQAFSRYVALTISFIEDKEYAQKVKAAILSVPVGGYDVEKSLSYTSTFDPKPDASSLTDEQEKYCRVTNEALGNLVAAERSKMDSKEKAMRTAKIAKALLSVHETWDEDNQNTSGWPGPVESIKGSDTESSLFSSLGSFSITKIQESNADGAGRGNDFFAKMCSQTLNMCNSLTSTLDMKYTILKHLIFPCQEKIIEGSRDNYDDDTCNYTFLVDWIIV